MQKQYTSWPLHLWKRFCRRLRKFYRLCKRKNSIHLLKKKTWLRQKCCHILRQQGLNYIGKGIVLAAFLNTSNNVQGQPFQFSGVNQFGLPPINYAYPAFADIDADGDMDAIIGEFGGNLQFLENTGDATTPLFGNMQTNPFGLYQVDSRAFPEFADMDSDGDVDLFVGTRNYGVVYFENTGSSSIPAFQVTTIPGLSFIGKPVPATVDIDADGDLDLFIASFGQFVYVENTGTTSAPQFDTLQLHPYDLTPLTYVYNYWVLYNKIEFADIDNDGDFDAFSAGVDYDDNDLIFYFENTGTTMAPDFMLNGINPFGLYADGYALQLSFVDIDNDGDQDAFIGAVSYTHLRAHETS